MDLFSVLSGIWESFEDCFTKQCFVLVFFFFFFHFLDFSYDKRKKKKGRLMNLFLDQAKLAICLSQKYKIDNGRNTDCVQMLDYLSIILKWMSWMFFKISGTIKVVCLNHSELLFRNVLI